jgi:hypothetical protein
MYAFDTCEVHCRLINKTLSIVIDQKNTWQKRWCCFNSPQAVKQPITKQVIEKLYDEVELVETDACNPAKLQQTAWVFIASFLGKRGHEDKYAC